MAILVLAGCGGTAAAPSSTAATAPATASGSSAGSVPAKAAVSASGAAKPAPSGLTKITMALSTTAASQLPFWMALDGGYFQKNGLEVTQRTVTGGSTTTATLISGEVQMVSGGGAEALSAITNGADLVIMATTGPKFEYVFEVSPSIKTPADLKGQHVGVPAIGGNADIAMHAVIRSFGMDPDKDVLITATGAQTTSLAALTSGAVAGTMLSPPSHLIAEQQGAHPLVNMAELPIYTTGGSIYTSRSFLTTRRDAVQAFVDSVVQGIARVKSDRTLSVALMKKYLKSDDDTAMNAGYEFYAKEFPSLPYAKPEYFQEAITTLSKSNDKIKSFDLGRVLDESLIKSAADRGLDRS